MNQPFVYVHYSVCLYERGHNGLKQRGRNTKMALEIAVIYDDVLDYMKIVFFRLQFATNRDIYL